MASDLRIRGFPWLAIEKISDRIEEQLQPLVIRLCEPVVHPLTLTTRGYEPGSRQSAKMP
jgi:hypothetical protein